MFRALEQCFERCQLRGTSNEPSTTGRIERVRQSRLFAGTLLLHLASTCQNHSTTIGI
jgi:hypothetical protein